MTSSTEEVGAAQVSGGGLAALAADVARELAGDGSPLGRMDAPRSSRVLRVEVNGSLHDWFDIDEMGDFVKSQNFADTLLENIARYFGVPVESQAIYDEDGLLTTSADFSRALQRVAPMLYIYDVNDMGPELKERTVEELATINAGVEQSWKNFRMLSSRGGPNTTRASDGEAQDSFQQEADKAQDQFLEARDDLAPGSNMASLAPDDALLSAKSASPTGFAPAARAGSQLAQQLVSSGGLGGLGLRDPASWGQTGPAGISQGSSANFGKLDIDVPPAGIGRLEPGTVDMRFGTDGQLEPIGVYSLLAPTSSPGSTSKPVVSTPALRVAEVSASGGLLGQTTARIPTGIRTGLLLPGTSSPPGPQVRKMASSILAPHTVSLLPQQQVRTSVEASCLQGVTRSPMAPTPPRSVTPPASARPLLFGSSIYSSAAAPAVSHWGNLAQPGTVDDVSLLGRMVSGMSGSQLLNQSLEGKHHQVFESLEGRRPMSPKRSLTPTRSLLPTARSVTPPPQTTRTVGLDARSLTPTRPGHAIGMDRWQEARLLNAGPPPVSPAQVNARSAGLLRMASNTQLPYRTSERAHSPIRAATPITARRSVTPTPAAQMGTESHAQLLWQVEQMARSGPLRSTLPVAAPSAAASNRALTPVRSVVHRNCLPGSQFMTPPMTQAAPGQIALGPAQHGSQRCK